MSRGRLFIAVVAAVAFAACTEVGTDPNAVVAVRFDGSAYPSIVAGDSLRDSLGALQPVRATGLNYKGEAVAGAAFVFSSPDTVLRLFPDGNVFATRRKTDANPARVFATIGSLQSSADTLFVVQRADSLKPAKQVDTALFVAGAGASTAPNSPAFQVFGDTAAGKPKATVQGWLVSFRLRYRGTTISASDTTFAYTFETVGSGPTSKRVQRIVDTTDASGNAGHRVFVRTLSAAEDTLFLIATIRPRKANAEPIIDSIPVVIRPAPPSTLRQR